MLQALNPNGLQFIGTYQNIRKSKYSKSIFDNSSTIIAQLYVEIFVRKLFS